jgi:hypothetical protein
MDENKSQPLHVTGILIYRIQRQVEFLLLNDTFSHKRHWTAPKGTVIRQEDEVKCALRNTIEITGLSVKDIRIEEGFRAEITYLSGTRPKRVVYYLAQVSDHARVYTTGEGLNFAWLSLNHAMEKALYKSMQEVIKKASIFIENNKPPKNTESSQRSRIDKHQITSDRLDHKMKNLNLALPLDSQRQAMSEQRLKLVRKQRQSQNQSEKNGSGNGSISGNNSNGLNNGFASPLHSPVMPFENPLYKTRLCERFETEGYCPYGPKCTFAHGTVELRERPANTEEKTDTSPTAKDGPDNPLYKTRLCERFVKENFCQYGPKCNFAHGDHELRDRPNATRGEDGSERDSPEPYHQQRQQQQPPPQLQSEQHHGRYQHPHHQARLNGVNNNDLEKRIIPASPGIGGGLRSEIQNGILGRIPMIVNDSHSAAHNSAHVEESKSETVEEYKKTEEMPEGNKAENEHETKEQQDHKEENLEVKDNKDLSAPSSTASGKSTSSAKRRVGKDIVSVDEKPWMQVVELSNVELERLGKIKKTDHAPTSDKRSHDDIIIADLKKFFIQSREQNKSISDEIKEITLIETRKDLSKSQLFNVLLPSMYDDMPWDVVNKDLEQKEKLFKTFIRGSQDQITFLRSWEKYLNSRNSKLLSKAALLFKAFYDKDYVEEDSVLEWYEQAKDTSDVKKKCAVFIDWLKNAEEED